MHDVQSLVFSSLLLLWRDSHSLSHMPTAANSSRATIIGIPQVICQHDIRLHVLSSFTRSMPFAFRGCVVRLLGIIGRSLTITITVVSTFDHAFAVVISTRSHIIVVTLVVANIILFVFFAVCTYYTLMIVLLVLRHTQWIDSPWSGQLIMQSFVSSKKGYEHSMIIIATPKTQSPFMEWSCWEELLVELGGIQCVFVQQVLANQIGQPVEYRFINRFTMCFITNTSRRWACLDLGKHTSAYHHHVFSSNHWIMLLVTWLCRARNEDLFWVSLL